MITCWRIFNPKRSVKQAISGVGSAKTGGRWNSVGIEMVYTSETLALASLEVLVHLHKKNILDGYQKVEFQVPEKHILTVPIDDLPDGWDEQCLDPVIAQQIGDRWIKDQDSLALRVPSSVINEEHNILINPNHPDWGDITVLDDTPFNYDKRLDK